jgi:hydrogenase-4 membrane subunit HyfE
MTPGLDRSPLVPRGGGVTRTLVTALLLLLELPFLLPLIAATAMVGLVVQVGALARRVWRGRAKA